MQRRRVIIVTVVVLALLGLTIGVYRHVTQETETELTAVIEPDGGVVEVTDPESPAHGVRIEIPEGAVETSAVASIVVKSDAPALPDGFNTGVTAVELDVSAELLDVVEIEFPVEYMPSSMEGLPCAFFYDELAGKWRVALPSDIDYDNMIMKIRTSHLSIWKWGWITIDILTNGPVAEAIQDALIEFIGEDRWNTLIGSAESLAEDVIDLAEEIITGAACATIEGTRNALSLYQESLYSELQYLYEDPVGLCDGLLVWCDSMSVYFLENIPERIVGLFEDVTLTAACEVIAGHTPVLMAAQALTLGLALAYSPCVICYITLSELNPIFWQRLGSYYVTTFGVEMTEAALDDLGCYDSEELDPSPLISGIDSICALGVPGPLHALDTIPIPVVAGDYDTTPVPSTVVMASKSGVGRVVALGHDGFLTNEALELFDNKQFGNNVMDWLDKFGIGKILVTTGHEEWYGSNNFNDFKSELESRGYDVTRFSGILTPSVLLDVGVVLIGNAWGNVLSSEIDALTDFVDNGGGLFLMGLGWSWEPYNPGFTLDDFPMNRIAEPYGIRWIDGYISDPTDNYEGQPIFHTFYPNIEGQTIYQAFSLTISSTAGGSVATPGEGTFTYDEGAMVNLVATPDANHQFVNWTGDVHTIADVEDASTTIIMDSDRSITANFEPTDSLCDYECQQATPGGYVGYQFEQSNFFKYEIIFNWTDTPKSNDVGIYPAVLHFWFEAGQGGYVGPQIEVYNSGERIVKKVIFSIWSMNNQQFTAHPYCSHGTYGDTEGNFVQCLIHNDPSATRGQYYEQMWEEGKEYKIVVQRNEELTDGVVWKATIEDLETGLETLIGKIKLDDQEPYKGYGLLNGYTGGFFEYYFGSDNKCLEAEYGKIIRKGPLAENVDGVWLPRKGTCLHSACIRAETYSPEVGVIVEEVGEGVERSPEEPLEQVLWEFEHDIESTEDATP